MKFVMETARALREKATRVPLRRREMENLWGLYAFCSQVVWGLALYIRRGFSFLAALAGRAKMKVTPPVQEDLDTIEEVIRQYNGRAVVLYRQDVKEDLWTTDSVGTKGMDGVMDTRFFLHSREDMRRMVQRPCFPFWKGILESEHINYLELFAVWWAVVVWGGTCRAAHPDRQQVRLVTGSYVVGPSGVLAPAAAAVLSVCLEGHLAEAGLH